MSQTTKGVLMNENKIADMKHYSIAPGLSCARNSLLPGVLHRSEVVWQKKTNQKRKRLLCKAVWCYWVSQNRTLL